MNYITVSEFTNRFTALVLGGSGSLPRKPLDRHILYVSVIQGMEFGRNYTESEINTLLMSWVDSFGGSFGLDYVSLRRYLVDDGYLQRDRAGRFYELGANPPYRIEPLTQTINLVTLVGSERAAREERKKRYTFS